MIPTFCTYLSMCTKTGDSTLEAMMVIWTTVVLVPGLEGKLRNLAFLLPNANITEMSIFPGRVKAWVMATICMLFSKLSCPLLKNSTLIWWSVGDYLLIWGYLLTCYSCLWFWCCCWWWTWRLFCDTILLCTHDAYAYGSCQWQGICLSRGWSLTTPSCLTYPNLL